jgi:hypothetical protein
MAAVAAVPFIMSVIAGVFGVSATPWVNLGLGISGNLGGAPLNSCENLELLRADIKDLAQAGQAFEQVVPGRVYKLKNQEVSVEFLSRSCDKVRLRGRTPDHKSIDRELTLEQMRRLLPFQHVKPRSH